MNTSMTRSHHPRREGWLSGLLAATLMLGSGGAALADDTEILTGSLEGFASPNILFVIDTSGSMNGQVLVDTDGYDPSIDYTGPYTDDSRFYYTLMDMAGNFSYPDAGYQVFGAYTEILNFACAAGRDKLATAGVYADFFIQFDENDNTWGFVDNFDTDPTQSGVTRLTECFADDGTHGLTGGAPGVYPADGDVTAPWTADPDDATRFDWTAYGARYVYFDNNYLNWVISSRENGTPVVQTRLEIVQGVTTDLVTRLAIDTTDPRQAFNVGLMRFSDNGDGGMVLKEIESVANEAGRETLINQVNGMSPSGNTPLSESLYEAYQYLRGGPVTYGLGSSPETSTVNSYAGANYISPIAASCQKNYVVLLTDGRPNGDNGADDAINAVTGSACDGTGGDNCLDDLAIHMDTADMSAARDDTQTVQTFTIGFFTDSPLLLNAATGTVVQGEGDDQVEVPGYFLADNTTELANAFEAIFNEIETDVTTFTSPATSVNSANRLQNRDILYFTLFQPSPMGEPHWDGNLKAYKIGREGGVDQSGNDEPEALTILDALGRPAINEDGTFKETARSIWSEQNDGGVVTEGGFVSRLSINRTIVTDANGVNLFNDNNIIDEGNPDISAVMLGIPVPADTAGADEAEERRKALLKFASGLNEDGSARRVIGDPLHTQPLVVPTGPQTDDLTLFLSTNDGYLHRIDPTPTGGGNIEDLEQWSFIPGDLLSNLDLIERNPPSLPTANNKLYGLDGPLTRFIDGGDDAVWDAGETLFVYSAMRRGGRNYYGLNLGTDRNGTATPENGSGPTRAFKITGGSGGFASLGQTWSAATPARIQIGDDERDVLIFGGGYDPAQENGYNNGSMGNAVYIVDARDGALLWSASDAGATLNLTEMAFPIPSDVTSLDMNQDGLVDRMYVGDLGGQVWRFDVIDGEISGTRLAALGGTGATNERRFFNAPRVARILTRTEDFLTIAIGSGWRAHPLATENNDRFFLIKDPNVFTPQLDGDDPVYPAPFTEEDLIAITLDNTGSTSSVAGGSGIGGWYLELSQDSGEKNLSAALIADNRVFFTTYSPSQSEASCIPTAAIGTGRLYALDILTGFPALVNADGSQEGFIPLDRTGIPPEPQLTFTAPPCIENCDLIGGDPEDDDQVVYETVGGTCSNPGSEVRLQVGLDGFDAGICTAPVRTYWSETDLEWGQL